MSHDVMQCVVVSNAISKCPEAASDVAQALSEFDRVEQERAQDRQKILESLCDRGGHDRPGLVQRQMDVLPLQRLRYHRQWMSHAGLPQQQVRNLGCALCRQTTATPNANNIAFESRQQIALHSHSAGCVRSWWSSAAGVGYQLDFAARKLCQQRTPERKTAS